jgi:BNR repeat-like domain
VRRGVVAGLIFLGLVSGLARAALVDRDATLQGTPRADLIIGTASADVVTARGGDDAISTAWDDVRDRIDCGTGTDVVDADLLDTVAANCETVARRVGRDGTSDWRAQHQTQVEPSALAWGKSVVTAFQSGRIARGGAAALGFATSPDAGEHWRVGTLPQGGYTSVSDAVVAFDAAHGLWLVAGLGAAAAVLDIFVVRSRDGVTWTGPVTAANDVDEDYDKEWLTCDNGASSPFRGHCYLAYVDIRTHELALRTTKDGGATWSKPTRVEPGEAGSSFSGPMPVVRPNGDVVVPYSLFAPLDREDRIAAVVSRDGGVTWGEPLRVASLIYEESLFELRAPVLPSAAVDAAGRVYVVWGDSRFRDDGTSMDAVLATSADGIHWSEPARITSVPGQSFVFVPALAVAGKRLALTYYTAELGSGCFVFHDGCAQHVDAWLAESADGGGDWARPRRLNAEPMAFDWLAETNLGRMLGDYVAGVFAGGRPIALIALAGTPGYEQSEAIFAVR